MSLIQQHKIHTASLQVQFEGIEEGLGLQDRLALVFHEKVKPALEKEFDQLIGPETTLVIDQLILDCGFITDEDWEEKLLQQVLGQVRKEIASKPSSQTQRITKGNKANEVFFYFMDKGYFPWNSPFSSTYEVEKALSIEIKFIGKLAQVIQKSSLVTERLFQSFSSQFISKIYGYLGKTLNPKIAFLYSLFQKQGWVTIQKVILENFISVIGEKRVISDQEFISILISCTPKKNISTLADFIAPDLIKDQTFREAFSRTLSEIKNPEFSVKIDQLIQDLKKKHPSSLAKVSVPKNIKKSNLKREETTIPKGSRRSKSDQSLDILPKPKSKTPSNKDLDIAEEIFIENAGLVILHPFLSGLFTNLQLVEKGKFESPSKQHMAAKVLQYLVYGENDLTENFFVLNKILSGMDVFEVLELNQELDKEFKKECEELLQVVIGHWSVLKNTSVDGLRETFLQRDGKISRVENGWKLKVERKTVDILMNKLPWGIGMIKLPWMNEMMFVDWD